MDQILLCQLIEAAHRAGIKAGLERCAVMSGHTMKIGDRPLQEVLVGVDTEPLDCYTITARSPVLTRLMGQFKRKS